MRTSAKILNFLTDCKGRYGLLRFYDLTILKTRYIIALELNFRTTSFNGYDLVVIPTSFTVGVFDVVALEYNTFHLKFIRINNTDTFGR